MKKYLEILKNCPLFKGIADEEIVRMLTCLGAKIQPYDKKLTVMDMGESARDIGIVISGSVQEIRIDYYGNRSILSRAKESDIFAEEFSCAGLSSIPVSFVTDKPSEIMTIDCNHIMHTCSNNCGFHQQLIYNLMKNLAAKSVNFHHRLEVTSQRTTREKLLSYLELKANELGTQSFDIPYDRQELADYLEVDRSGLSAEIGKLRREGVIECRKNHFEIL
ncbi:MAG: Crp/Fnr family transcriptional regulator [Ruminococcaceae bacterium]|nr:Crp/Fnr family transcriptional regulator [Oscillospiraceae bacterium]